MQTKSLDFLGFPNYEINTLGEVKNVKRESFLLGQKNKKSGYWSVQLSEKGNKKRFYLHRLVALAFLENKENKETVNHKDGNLDNNSLENLEWATQKENSDHAYRVLGREKNSFTREAIEKANKKTSKRVLKLSLDGEVLKEYPSLMEASREEGISRHSIRDVAKGRKKSHKNFVWKFV